MKKMNILYITISLIVFLLIVSQLYAVNETNKIEMYPYTVVKNYGAFEIRRYEPANFTSVTMAGKTYDETANRGFRTLAGYIFGGNETNEKIAMTSPVAMSMGDSVTMKFLIPSDKKMETLPKPNSSNIQFTSEPEKTLAAIKFGGWANDKRIAEYTDKLKEQLKKNGIAYTGKFSYLGYNPPFMLVNRRNEIVVEIVY